MLVAEVCLRDRYLLDRHLFEVFPVPVDVVFALAGPEANVQSVERGLGRHQEFDM